MRTLRGFLQIAAASLLLAAPAAAQKGFPFTGESLRYSINWPSGLSLGESTLTAHKTDKGWDFDVTLEAGVPGFAMADKFRSLATGDLCSLELDRDISHGGRKSREKTTFLQEAGKAHRVTVFPADGGTTDFDIPSCARDALALVYYTRKELGQGRVPPAQTVFFGSSYSVRMDYAGAETITGGDKKPAVTDHMTITVRGPKANFTCEVFYARDAARTPLAIRVPLALGTFSMELVR
ncbi:MAG: DUF3108 domain-containing protein [Acidobacteriia bacterium]|nr:DUF3108 domain-containing protein [Terriglobia bacterium]